MEEYKRIKKIIIISPHFPPSNLTAVHRARFFAQHLPSFGWEPTIVTVHEDCLLYTSPSPRDRTRSRMPSSAWKKKKTQPQNNSQPHLDISHS